MPSPGGRRSGGPGLRGRKSPDPPRPSSSGRPGSRPGPGRTVQDGESSFPRAGKLIRGSGNSIGRRETRSHPRRGQFGAGKLDFPEKSASARSGNSDTRETHLEGRKLIREARNLAAVGRDVSEGGGLSLQKQNRSRLGPAEASRGQQRLVAAREKPATLPQTPIRRMSRPSGKRA